MVSMSVVHLSCQCTPSKQICYHATAQGSGWEGMHKDEDRHTEQCRRLWQAGTTSQVSNVLCSSCQLSCSQSPDARDAACPGCRCRRSTCTHDEHNAARRGLLQCQVCSRSTSFHPSRPASTKHPCKPLFIRYFFFA